VPPVRPAAYAKSMAGYLALSGCLQCTEGRYFMGPAASHHGRSGQHPLGAIGSWTANKEASGHELVACLKVRSPILTKSRRFHVCSEQGTRCGHDMVYRIGSRMSGQPSCITAQHVTPASTTETAREMITHQARKPLQAICYATLCSLAAACGFEGS
jgi:hypothetical protein